MIYLLGIVVGLSSSLLGIGGGVIIVPLLPLLVAMPHQEVIATSLANVFFVTLVNTYFFHRNRLVAWKRALVMGPVTAVGALITGFWAQGFSDFLLKLIFAIILSVFTLKILLGKRQELSEAQVHPKAKGQEGLKSTLLAAMAGGLSGMSGVGSGMILSPALLHFRFVKNIQVAPTSNAIMIFTTLFALVGYVVDSDRGIDIFQLFLGDIHLEIVLKIVPIAILVAFWGRKVQHLVPENIRRNILSGLLLVLSIKTIWSLLA